MPSRRAETAVPGGATPRVGAGVVIVLALLVSGPGGDREVRAGDPAGLREQVEKLVREVASAPRDIVERVAAILRVR